MLSKKNANEKFIVEIGEHFLKVVYYRLPNKVKWVEYGTISGFDNKEVSDAIREIFQEKGISASRGILCFPRNRLTIGTLHLPSVDKNEIVQMVEVNVSSQVPYPREEIIADWHVVAENEAGYADVILAVIQKSLVSEYFMVLAAAGFEIENVEIASESIFGWLFAKEKEFADLSKPCFILNIDYGFTDLILYSGKDIFMSHLISQGQKDLSADEGGAASFITELKQIMGMIPPSFLDVKLNKIFICGAEKYFDILEKKLIEEFNFEVTSVKIDRSFSQELSFTPLLGIVHNKRKKQFKFDIPELRIRKEWKKKVKQFVYLSGILTYVFLISIAAFVSQVYKRKEYLERLKTECKEVRLEAKNLEVSFKKIRIIEDIKFIEGGPLYYLSQIAEPASVGCRIVDFKFTKNDKVNIKGEASSMSDFYDFLSKLEDLDIFSEVEQRYTRKARNSAEGKSEFEIVCYIVN